MNEDDLIGFAGFVFVGIGITVIASVLAGVLGAGIACIIIGFALGAGSTV